MCPLSITKTMVQNIPLTDNSSQLKNCQTTGNSEKIPENSQFESRDLINNNMNSDNHNTKTYSTHNVAEQKPSNGVNGPNGSNGQIKRDSIRNSFRSYFSLKSVDTEDYVSCKSSLNSSAENMKVEPNEKGIDETNTILVGGKIVKSDKIVENEEMGIEQIGLINATKVTDSLIRKNSVNSNKTILKNGNGFQNHPNNSITVGKDTSESDILDKCEKLNYENSNTQLIETEKTSRLVESNMRQSETKSTDNVPKEKRDARKHLTDNRNSERHEDHRQGSQFDEFKVPNEMKNENLDEIKVFVDDIVKESETRKAIDNEQNEHVVNMDVIVIEPNNILNKIEDENNRINEALEDKKADSDLSVENRYKIKPLDDYCDDKVVIDIGEEADGRDDGEFKDVPLDVTDGCKYLPI